jgi:hypothetical protein
MLTRASWSAAARGREEVVLHPTLAGPDPAEPQPCPNFATGFTVERGVSARTARIAVSNARSGIGRLPPIGRQDSGAVTGPRGDGPVLHHPRLDCSAYRLGMAAKLIPPLDHVD